MEKITCNDLVDPETGKQGRSIDRRQCCPRLGSIHCKSCDYRIIKAAPKLLYKSKSTRHERKLETVAIHESQVRPLTHLSPERQNKSRSVFHADQVKWLYDFLLNEVHPSFWENPKFLRWQLMRLNDQYQNDIDALCEAYSHYWEDDSETMEWVKSIFYELGQDYDVGAGKTFEQWERQGRLEISGIEDKLLRLRAKSTGPRHWWGPKPSIIMTIADDYEKQWLIPPSQIYLADVFPIYYKVRFPLPYFLDKLPEWRDKRKERWGGTPLHWPLGLLINELSQAGLRPYEIVNALGLKQEAYDQSAKKSGFNRVRDAKKRIGDLINRAYPLPPAVIESHLPPKVDQ